MAAALAHRGPDDEGIWASPPAEGDPPITLVHRRLAIQDLSPAGHQPMASACGRYVVVFNGEIYNQLELRAELEALGHHFRSRSDTEVLLEMHARYGLAMLQRLRGMYAFAMVDRQEQRVLLARDPFGIKPLYIWHGPDGQLLFASEVRALLASDLVPRQLDRAGLYGFLVGGSVPEPLTLVEGVQSLPAGWYGLWQHGAWHTHPHWQPCFAPGLPLPAAAVPGLVRAAISDSVRAHQISDVPVGLFLSGGIDSSAILALSPNTLTTLTIGFPEGGFDESQRAAATARHFGANHTPLLLDRQQGQGLLPAFLAATDQPSVDGFNTYCVSSLARQQGLKVVLSGVGGDELFGGYKSFRLIPRLLRLHRALGPLRPAAAAVLRRRPGAHAQRMAAFFTSPGTPATAQRCLRGLFAPSEARHLMRCWGLTPPDTLPFDPAGDDATPPVRPMASLGERINAVELRRYLGAQLLRDADVYSMAHGLELRLPLVDAQLFDAVVQLPPAQRLARGKALFHQAVPEVTEELGPISKWGFLFPFQRWFETSTPPVPSHGVDLTPWARRWALMVLTNWLDQHMGITLC